MRKPLIAAVAVAALVVAAGSLTESSRAASTIKVRALSAVLTSGEEVPPVSATGFGVGFFTLNESSRSLTYSITYRGLSGPPSGAHLHLGAPGVDGDVLITLTAPAAVDGSITGTQSALTPEQVGQLLKGLFYVNIHTAAHPGGELRGQLLPSPVKYKLPASSK